MNSVLRLKLAFTTIVDNHRKELQSGTVKQQEAQKIINNNSFWKKLEKLVPIGFQSSTLCLHFSFP